MTTNWQEEQLEEIASRQIFLLDGKKGTLKNTIIYDSIVNLITTLLEKQREEYVEMITNLYADDLPSDDVFNEWENGRAEAYIKVINLIKTHDKTS